jgi:hypothetical protein
MTTDTWKVHERRDWTCQSQVSDVLKEVPSQSHWRQSSSMVTLRALAPAGSHTPKTSSGTQSCAGTEQLVPQIKHPQIHPLLLVGHNKELWPSFFIIHQPLWCLCYVSPGLTSTYATLCPQSNICMVCTCFRTNSNHFLIQHSVTGFTTENACVFCAVWIASLNNSWSLEH